MLDRSHLKLRSLNFNPYTTTCKNFPSLDKSSSLPGGDGSESVSVRCVNSKAVSNSTGDGSMRGGVNAGDRRVLICIQLVIIEHPTTLTFYRVTLTSVLPVKSIKFCNFVSVN